MEMNEIIRQIRITILKKINEMIGLVIKSIKISRKLPKNAKKGFTGI